MDVRAGGAWSGRMVVVQRGNEPTEDRYAQASAGWEHFFDVMAEMLAA